MPKTSTYLLLALLLTSCSSGSVPRTRSVPGRGTLSIEVDPNPIIATRVTGETYDFSFEAIVRETSGSAVTMQRVSVSVTAFGGIPVYSESYGRDEFTRRGFPSMVAARGELRYKFNLRKDVPDERLFSAVSAELKVEGLDETGDHTSARTTVTVRR